MTANKNLYVRYEILRIRLRYKHLSAIIYGINPIKQKDIFQLERKTKSLYSKIKRKQSCSIFYNYDILIDVLKYLELSEIAKSQLVSKGWNNTVTGINFRFYKQFYSFEPN